MNKNEILDILEIAKDKNGEVPMRLVRQAFDKLQEYQKGEWIPCSERLPEENTDILVTYVDGEEMRIIPVNYGRGTWYDCIFDAALDPLKITAWMPLPEPYEGK